MSSDNGVLLFGGTFDPIHNGHLIVARAAAEQLGVDKVVLIPSAQPPHKDAMKISAAKDRLAMVRLAAETDDLFEVSDCELRRRGPSYTLDTVRQFRQDYGSGVKLYWLIGADSVRELALWYRVDELVDECVIVTAGRPGYTAEDYSVLAGKLSDEQVEEIRKNRLDTPLVDVSATEIRRCVKAGLSINDMAPTAVAKYIKAKLYQSD